MTTRCNMLVAAMLATIGFGTTAVPAFASPVEEIGDQVIARVRFSDLDLSAKAGEASLRLRVQKASRQVCAAVTNGETMVDPDFRSCYEQAFGSAWNKAETEIAAAQARAVVASNQR